MKRIRGFLLKHRVTALFRCIYRKNRSTGKYHRLDPYSRSETRCISKLLKWGTRLKTKAIAMCCNNSNSRSGYVPIGHDPDLEKVSRAVPRGQMAVYVGQKDCDFRRVLVPVLYFNHPLFGQLLREAEKEYGHDYPGGITIPCRISEFENVKTQIDAGRVGRKMMTWRRGVI